MATSQKPPRPAMAQEPTSGSPEVLSMIPDEYLAAMGRVSAAWSLLDFTLDMAICEFVQAFQLLGVCVTSQLTSTPARLNALGGLMRAHGMPSRRIKWLDKFHQKSHGLARKRNRAVHDAIMLGRQTGTIYRMSATLGIDKDVAFGVTPSNVDELRLIFEEIRDHVLEFGAFWHETSGELATLRQTVPLSSFQIYPTPPQPAPEPRPEDNPRRRRSSPRTGRRRSK